MKNSYCSFLLRLSRFQGSVEKITSKLFYTLLISLSFNNLSYSKNLNTNISLDASYQSSLKLFQKNPLNWSFRYDLIQSLIKLEKRKEALVLYGEWIPQAPKENAQFIVDQARRLSRLFFNEKSQAVYLEGVHFLINKKYTESLSRFLQAIQDEPDHIEVLVRIGQSYFFLGDDTNALGYFQRATDLSPWDPQLTKWLAHTYSKRGNYKKAISLFEEIQESPFLDKSQSEFLVLWFAEALWNSGKRTQAIKKLENDFKNNAFHLEVLSKLARYRAEISLNDKELLNQTKLNIQLLLSRLPDIKLHPDKIGAEVLDHVLYDFEKLKTSSEQLMEVVEQRLNRKTNDQVY